MSEIGFNPDYVGQTSNPYISNPYWDAPGTNADTAGKFQTVLADVTSSQGSGNAAPGTWQPKPIDGPPGQLTQTEVTQRLQHYTTEAAREVDAAGNDAFTPAQRAAMQQEPWLRPLYRGERIDKLTRQFVEEDPDLNSRITGSPNNGPDFIDKETGVKYDMTTEGAFPKHVGKYGDDLQHLDTSGKAPDPVKSAPADADPPPASQKANPTEPGDPIEPGDVTKGGELPEAATGEGAAVEGGAAEGGSAAAGEAAGEAGAEAAGEPGADLLPEILEGLAALLL
jgi:hypothetical protein